MGQVGERPAVRGAARLELLRGDEQGRDEAGRDQEQAHRHGRCGEQALGATDPSLRRGVRPIRVVPVAADLRDHGHPGLEPGEAQRQLREDEQGDADDEQRIPTGPHGEQARPAGDDLRVGGHAQRRVDDHDRVQSQVQHDEHDRDADRLLEPAQEHRAERQDQQHRDRNLRVVQRARHQRVLDRMRGRVRRRQGDRDHEVGRGEAEQHQDEQLAAPPGQQPLEHGDGTLTAVALLGHAPVDGERAEQREGHEHEGREGRDHPGGQERDGGLVAQGREVVDAGEAHDPQPVVRLLGAAVRSLVSARAVAQPFEQPAREPAAVAGRAGGDVRDGGLIREAVRPEDRAECGRRVDVRGAPGGALRPG